MDEPIYGMLPPPAIALVHRLNQRVDSLNRAVLSTQAQLDQARDIVDTLRRDIGKMAVPVPDGYVHAPGCVRGAQGWHTCYPIPDTE